MRCGLIKCLACTKRRDKRGSTMDRGRLAGGTPLATGQSCTEPSIRVARAELAAVVAALEIGSRGLPAQALKQVPTASEYAGSLRREREQLL